MILRNTDTIPRLGTCESSKNRFVFATAGSVWWAYSIRPYNRVCVILRKTILFSSPLVPSVGRIQYAPRIGYVRSFEISMRFSNRVRMILQKAVPFSSSTGPSVGRIRYAPTTRYVRSFEIPMQFPNRVHAILRNTDAIFQPSTYEGSKNGSVYATVGRVWWGVYDTLLRPGTCGPSKNYPVFVPFGAVCGAYSIRPYNRVRAALQKTVPFSSPLGPLVGRMQYAPTTGYVRGFKK